MWVRLAPEERRLVSKRTGKATPPSGREHPPKGGIPQERPVGPKAGNNAITTNMQNAVVRKAPRKGGR